MESFFANYLYSLVEFWGSVFRIGLPQILLVVLVIWWLKRKRCGRDDGDDGCCGFWGFGPRYRCCRAWSGPCCDERGCRRGACDQTEAETEAAADVEEAVVADD